MPRIPLQKLLFCLVIAGLTGCGNANKVRAPSDADPWEGFNRAMYRFNDALDRAILKPIAKGYQKTPLEVQEGIGNFFENLTGPNDIINNFAQGKFRRGFSSVGRLLMNTTVGLFGLFDPASRVGLARYNEDFGQTLAKWGVPSGPYIVLPLLGPSTVRDAAGGFVNRRFDPLFQHEKDRERYLALVINIIDLRASFLDAEAALEDAYDPYSFIRDAWLQRRIFLIHDGDPPPPEESFDDIFLDDLDDFEDFEEFEGFDTAPTDEETDNPDPGIN